MKESVEKLVKNCLAECSSADTLPLLQQAKVKYLGKNGELTAILRGLKDAAPQERPIMGNLVNEAKDRLEEAFLSAEKRLKQKFLDRRLENEREDVTLVKYINQRGTLHPITLVTRDICDIFTGIGFQVLQGPEIEEEYFNFEALNIPKGHPARDMQDSFYITEEILLRTHTSPNQVRTMLKNPPPLKMLCPGRVYRADSDSSHSPVFHQIEGLVVDKHLTLGDLLGTLDYFAKKMFSPDAKVRLRPSYFPFTEPSVEVDLSCSNCGGKGCSLCKGSGWVEILGAGMVHPAVLENCNINPKEFNGFAFGIGIERTAIIKYGITDIRLFFENDARFLKQFKG